MDKFFNSFCFWLGNFHPLARFSSFLASPFGQIMVLAGGPSQHFAGSGDFEAFGY